VVTTAFDKELSDVACVNCGQCVFVYPTGALIVKSEIDKVWNAIHNQKYYAKKLNKRPYS